ncbi:hypothetical protein GCM10010430_24060 [Kitasatospora cystarginea]|uniref:Uncharacterized protein n=1 Tax=Kitasatospora cystarginea TaxID=58350 RepID=A0ABP5QQD5_9ACTN
MARSAAGAVQRQCGRFTLGFTNFVTIGAAEERSGYVYAPEALGSAAWTPEQTSAFLAKAIRDIPHDDGEEKQQ